MRLPILPALAAALVTVGACATMEPPGIDMERSAQMRLDRGLTALEAGRYEAAFGDLAWVYSHCPDRQAGTGALTALAVLELDPRNPEARPGLGTELLARLVSGPAPRASRLLAETAFLTSVALGAPHPDDATVQAPDSAIQAGPDNAPPDSAPLNAAPQEDAHRAALAIRLDGEEPVADCGPGFPVPDAPRPLPRLPGPTMAELLASAETARDSALVRADSLGMVLTALQEQLIATRVELERIRRTLKP